MAAYVDPLMKHPVSSAWRWGWACHLTADTETELHAFAAKIGMKRAWFQPHALLPHYDLTPFRRQAAINAGAIEITHRATYARIKARRGANL